MSRTSRPRLLSMALLLALALFVPWTRRTITAQAELRPVSVARIEAPDDSRVATVLAREGDRVSKGTGLFGLESLAAEADVIRSTSKEDRFLAAASTAREAGASATLYQSERRAHAAGDERRSGAMRRQRLDLRSPIHGRLLTPRIEDLEGRFVFAGTLLAEVGDCRRLVADLPVSERRLDELELGSPARALLPQEPLHPVQGKIESISPAALDRPPTVSTPRDPAPPSELPERFVARVVFENPGGELRPGDTVRAKIYGKRTSYASRTWRMMRRWLDTVVW